MSSIKKTFLFFFSVLVCLIFLFGFFENAKAVIGDACGSLPGTACVDGGVCYENICKGTCPSVSAYGAACSGGRCYPRKNGEVIVMICETDKIAEVNLPCGLTDKSICKIKEYDALNTLTCGALYTFDTGGTECDPNKNLVCCKPPPPKQNCTNRPFGEKCSGAIKESYCYNGVCESEPGELGAPCGTLGGTCMDIGLSKFCPSGTWRDSLANIQGGKVASGIGCSDYSNLGCCVDATKNNDKLYKNYGINVCKFQKDGIKCGLLDGSTSGFCFNEKCEFDRGAVGAPCGDAEKIGTCKVSCQNGEVPYYGGRHCELDGNNINCCVSSKTTNTDPPKNNPVDLSALYPKHVFCTDPQLEEGTTAGFQLFKGSIVPCGRSCDDKKTDNIDEMDECTLCHFILMGKRIYDFVLSLLIIVSLFTITIGGILYMISGANPSLNSTAKEIIKKTLFGFALFLGSWLIVFTVLTLLSANTSLIGKGGDKWFEFSCDTKSAFSLDGKEIDGGDDDGGGDEEEPEEPGDGNIPAACEDFSQLFDEVSGGDENLKCLLASIAMSESSCNANADNGKGDCGLMQISGGDCQHWKDNPKESIEYAKNMLSSNKSIINSYESEYGYDIGSSYAPGATATSKYGKTYYTGNDDLIASYNGGAGDGVNEDEKKEPFHLSSDCKAPDYPATPAWQCPINPGDFGTATQPYVVNVQTYQRQCLGK